MQLFVVHNPKTSQVWVFNNHDAAMRCRQEQKLNHWHLWGCVVFDDWRNGEPMRVSITAGKLGK
jgi:hypothetical protein